MISKYLIEYNPKESRKLNIIGLRATYGLTLMKLKEEFNDLAVFTADTSTSAGLDRFRQSYPDSFFDVGIAEQAMIAIAAGYVANGGTAIASTFAPFLMLRGAEQIRLSLGYMKLPLIVTGLASGLALGYLGYTHCCIEDTALALSIPNIFLYTPSDSYELKSILPYIIKMKRPCYIRLTGSSKTKAVHKSEFETDFFSPIPIHKGGDDLLILSTGIVSGNVNEALKQLDESYTKRLSHYILPFIDQEKTQGEITQLVGKYKNIIFNEEALYGGIASLVTKALLDCKSKPKLLLNIHPNNYIECGSHDFMLSQINLGVENIKEQVVRVLS